MSERYSKLFSLPENLYAEGAPVIVSAGNLLKDNQTGKVLAQLKIKNIAARPLKAATVLIHPQDAAGKLMADDTQQKYLDLTAKTGEEFGQKTAVFLPDDSTRGFSVEVTQAVFADNSTWDGTAAPWESLPVPESLSGKLGDAELLKQYRIKFGDKCETVPQVNRDLWRCACGAWNRGEKCYSCEKGKKALLSLDLDALKAEKDARLAKEKAEREAKEAAEKAAAEAKAKKTKKLLSVLIPAVVLCAAAVLLITKVIAPNINYNKAVSLIQKGQYEEAIILLRRNVDYKDSRRLILQADHGIQEEKRIENEARIEAEKAAAYEKAETLFNAGNLDGAISAFKNLGKYKDSDQRVEEIVNTVYSEAEALLDGGNSYAAAITFYRIKDYRDARERCFSLWRKLTHRATISAGSDVTIGLKANGAAIAVGTNEYGQCNVKNWEKMVSISTSRGFYFTHTVGLRESGTVTATGSNKYGQCNVGDWKDIVAVSAGEDNTIGLKADGTVVAVGHNYNGECNVDEWTDIITISAGNFHTVGLKADGTVVAVGSNHYGQCNVGDWRDIVAISAGEDNTIGVKADGTIVVVGSNKEGKSNVSGWTNIVAISAGCFHTVGLKADGTVVAVGRNKSGECNVDEWTNIVAISAGCFHTVGLKTDGTVVAVGSNYNGECTVEDWIDILVP